MLRDIFRVILRGLKILAIVGIWTATALGLIYLAILLLPEWVIVGLAAISGIIGIAFVLGRIAEQDIAEQEDYY